MAYQVGDLDQYRQRFLAIGQEPSPVRRLGAQEPPAELEGDAIQEGGLTGARITDDHQAALPERLLQLNAPPPPGFHRLGGRAPSLGAPAVARQIGKRGCQRDVQLVDGKAMRLAAAHLEAADVDVAGAFQETGQVLRDTGAPLDGRRGGRAPAARAGGRPGLAALGGCGTAQVECRDTLRGMLVGVAIGDPPVVVPDPEVDTDRPVVGKQLDELKGIGIIGTLVNAAGRQFQAGVVWIGDNLRFSPVEMAAEDDAPPGPHQLLDLLSIERGQP